MIPEALKTKYPASAKVVNADGDACTVHSHYYEGGCFLETTEGKDIGLWPWSRVALYREDVASEVKPLAERHRELVIEAAKVQGQINAIMLLAKLFEEESC